jgi:hypothetical protein
VPVTVLHRPGVARRKKWKINMGSLGHLEQSFTRVGWFIPPYMQLGALHQIAREIAIAGQHFTQQDLERALARLYEPEGLAAMVSHRYPVVPIIQDFKITIREAIEAHFLGLDHVAAGGLAPVIEGAGRRLAAARNLSGRSVKDVFTALAGDCKQESATRGLGAVDEVASMMDSFGAFACQAFFADSRFYPFGDGTNRHGIAHGAYSDADYGNPINFYKMIAAVDFLTFVASFGANISWLAPNPSAGSMRLALYYRGLIALRKAEIFYAAS